MTDIVYIPDHTTRIVSKIPFRLRQPGIISAAQAIAYEVQALEDDIFDFLESSSIDVATGKMLDRWGDYVGEPRLGLSDVIWRRVIKAKTIALKASSRRTYMTAFVAALFDEAEITYSDYLGAYRLHVTSNSLIDDALKRRVLRLLETATPAGIQSSISEGSLDDFRFDRTPGFGRRFCRVLRS
jgi:hypothetical protein